MKSLIIGSFSLFLCISLQAQIPSDSVYTQVDSAASFEGGPHAWIRFLGKNLRYPKAAQDKEIQGTVVLKYLVGTDGVIRDVTAISGPQELRAEAIRVIKLSKTRIPAIKTGKNVKSYNIEPISFRLESQ